MEVVERAPPHRQLALGAQPNEYYAIAAQPRNGATNPTSPTTLTSANLTRITSGSSSAPARKVSTTAPEAARKRTHSALAARISPKPKNPVAAAAETPTQISTNAIDIRREEAMRAETIARASHRDAVIKTCSIQESSVPARVADCFGPVVTTLATTPRLRQ